MRRLLALALAFAVLGGCSSHRGTVIGLRPVRPAQANLALGPTAEHAQLAQTYARSDWPTVETGLRIEDVVTYSTTTYDEQFHFDRFGGLYRAAESVQTGVQLR